MNIYCFSTLSFAKLQFKSVINKVFHKHGVASFTDAWIETNSSRSPIIVTGRIFYRCVDWNSTKWRRSDGISSRIFYRCVDWNVDSDVSRSCSSSRIFYRCVDWNSLGGTINWNGSKSHLLQMRGLKLLFGDRLYLFREQVASFTDAWIETFVLPGIKYTILSHLLQMRGLKQRSIINTLKSITSHLLQMRGLKPNEEQQHEI